MRNLKKIQKGVFLITLLLFSQQIIAQNTDALNSFTPYSIFGLGDVLRPGTAFNMGMGGIGVGVRDNRVINYLNPAAISDRDTLSFMLDFGLEQKNFYMSDNKTKSAYNAFDVHHLIITLPIFKKSAMIIGITPYSSVGYKFEQTETDPAIVAEMGDVKYQKYGTGGINKLFLGGSLKLSNNLSFGAEGIYYFGTIDRYSNILFNSNSTYRSIKTGMDYVVGSFSGKFGLLYSQKLANNMNLSLGATYLLKSQLKGDLTRYSFAINSIGTIDTITFNTTHRTQMEIPSEIALGASLRKADKWMIGADYVRQDWSNTSFTDTPGINFESSLSNTYKLGFEFTPNRYDVRYYLRRVTYRGGAYYEKSYMSLGGNQVNSAGLTLGASFPIFRWYNSIGIAVDMGQRGSIKNNMVRERYLMFIINVGLHDITWFRKYKYD
ncbi:MAG: hypothetical protein ABFC28_03530 [Rikenellaceae bacterium]